MKLLRTCSAVQDVVCWLGYGCVLIAVVFVGQTVEWLLTVVVKVTEVEAMNVVALQGVVLVQLLVQVLQEPSSLASLGKDHRQLGFLDLLVVDVALLQEVVVLAHP